MQIHNFDHRCRPELTKMKNDNGRVVDKREANIRTINSISSMILDSLTKLCVYGRQANIYPQNKEQQTRETIPRIVYVRETSIFPFLFPTANRFSHAARPMKVVQARFQYSFCRQYLSLFATKETSSSDANSTPAMGEDDISSKIVFSRQVATYVTRNPWRRPRRAPGIYRV